MKKSMIILALLAICFASCKKDHTCVCVYANGSEQSIEYKNSKKKDAKAACDNFAQLYKRSCTFK